MAHSDFHFWPDKTERDSRRPYFRFWPDKMGRDSRSALRSLRVIEELPEEPKAEKKVVRLVFPEAEPSPKFKRRF